MLFYFVIVFPTYFFRMMVGMVVVRLFEGMIMLNFVDDFFMFVKFLRGFWLVLRKKLQLQLRKIRSEYSKTICCPTSVPTVVFDIVVVGDSFAASFMVGSTPKTENVLVSFEHLHHP